MQMKFAKKHPGALTPKYMTEGAACFDIFALVEGESIVIQPGQAVAVRTGLAVEIPVGWRLDIVSRSGLWFKQRVRVGQGRGTIDHDFRGEIMVSLENSGTEPFVVRQHDRIAQGELNKVTRVEFVECALEALTETERGAGGFGSTGVSS
ncbi:dUTP diphosphatase [Burkholderia multivorans]|uniref:dUTP diphosphatase n=1 Tax=Burkholderia multivorans TaxID=87883 RepID=UPI001C23DFAA|nr:dUTP diphosphatase [Burkholderia multivorans]MBU9200327.1 dUTP diphosphatase [Burkholderia multivorans]MDN8078547.1 dUTP diphosphatase [Burkholderia multivorans]